MRGMAEQPGNVRPAGVGRVPGGREGIELHRRHSWHLQRPVAATSHAVHRITQQVHT